MTRAEIVARVAQEVRISKAAAGKALTLITDSIATSIRKGQKVTLAGFGTLGVVQRKAGNGRNPQTGKEIKTAAKKAPVKKAAPKKAAPKKAAVKKAPAKKTAPAPAKRAAK